MRADILSFDKYCQQARDGFRQIRIRALGITLDQESRQSPATLGHFYAS